MQKAYSRINWSNAPSTATPLGESNLLPMDASIDEIDNRIVNFDTTKANQSELLSCLSGVTYNSSTGVFVFTWKNGNTLTADLNIEKIPVNFSMSAAGVITMTTSDGSTYTADVGDLIKTYTFQDSSEIDFTTTTDASGNKTITASLVDGSISGSKLYPNYLADCQAAVSNSSANATLAQSWAVGGTNTRTGEDTNNAEYWCEMSRQASGDGHTIIDSEGTLMTNRSGLQFTGNVTITDDSANDKTIVNISDDMDATNVNYDNTTSGLSADNAQEAVDELASKLTNVAYKNVDNSFTQTQTINRNDGTTSAVGNSYVILGNNIPSGTAKNSRGVILLFGNGDKYAQIYDNGALTANRNLNLPDASGTIALTSDITAANATYSNTTSGLTATKVQGAIDELNEDLNGTYTNISKSISDLDSMTNTGRYYVIINETSGIFTNGGTYFMEVFRTLFGGASLGIVQRISIVYPPRGQVWQRSYYSAGGWSAWKELSN